MFKKIRSKAFIKRFEMSIIKGLKRSKFSEWDNCEIILCWMQWSVSNLRINCENLKLGLWLFLKTRKSHNSSLQHMEISTDVKIFTNGEKIKGHLFIIKELKNYHFI